MLLARNPLPADLLARIAQLEPRPYTGRPLTALEKGQHLAAMLERYKRDPSDWRAARVVRLLDAWRTRAAHGDLA